MNEGYGIMPNSVIKAKDLNSTQKLFICVLSSLSADKGYVYAGNEYIAERFNISKVQVSRILGELEKKKYIRMEYEREGSVVKSRRIYVLPLTGMLSPVNLNDNGTVNINVKENIITNNNINNNISVQVEELYKLYISKKPIGRRVNKKTALTHIEKILKDKDYGYDYLKKVINNYLTQLEDSKFFKNPEKFFSTSLKSEEPYFFTKYEVGNNIESKQIDYEGLLSL